MLQIIWVSKKKFPLRDKASWHYWGKRKQERTAYLVKQPIKCDSGRFQEKRHKAGMTGDIFTESKDKQVSKDLKQ